MNSGGIPTNDSSESGPDPTSGESVLREIEDALRGLKFGQVVVVVQDGVVVQIERVERRRLQRRKPE